MGDSACLGECGGTEQYEINGFLYHYHIVGPVGDLESSPTDPLPDSSMQPYTIGCFKGVVYDWSILAGGSVEQNCNRTGVTSSFEAAALEGITEIWTLTAAPTAVATTAVPLSSSTSLSLSPSELFPAPTSVPTSVPSSFSNTTSDPMTTSSTSEDSEPTRAPTSHPIASSWSTTTTTTETTESETTTTSVVIEFYTTEDIIVDENMSA